MHVGNSRDSSKLSISSLYLGVEVLSSLSAVKRSHTAGWLRLPLLALKRNLTQVWSDGP